MPGKVLLVVGSQVLVQLVELYFVLLHVKVDSCRSLRVLDVAKLGEDLRHKGLLAVKLVSHEVDVLLSALQGGLRLQVVLVERLHLLVELLDHRELLLLLTEQIVEFRLPKMLCFLIALVELGEDVLLLPCHLELMLVRLEHWVRH